MWGKEREGEMRVGERWGQRGAREIKMLAFSVVQCILLPKLPKKNIFWNVKYIEKHL